jgi:hypothetical protein
MKIASALIFKKAKYGFYKGYCEGGYRKLTNEIVAADINNVWNEVIGRRIV